MKRMAWKLCWIAVPLSWGCLASLSCGQIVRQSVYAGLLDYFSGGGADAISTLLPLSQWVNDLLSRLGLPGAAV